MALDYIPLRTALTDGGKFPKGICPFMSRMQMLMMPAAASALDSNSRDIKVALQETFLPAPCVGDMCAVWNDGVCGMKKKKLVKMKSRLRP